MVTAPSASGADRSRWGRVALTAPPRSTSVDVRAACTAFGMRRTGVLEGEKPCNGCSNAGRSSSLWKSRWCRGSICRASARLRARSRAGKHRWQRWDRVRFVFPSARPGVPILVVRHESTDLPNVPHCLRHRAPAQRHAFVGSWGLLALARHLRCMRSRCGGCGATWISNRGSAFRGCRGGFDHRRFEGRCCASGEDIPTSCAGGKGPSDRWRGRGFIGPASGGFSEDGNWVRVTRSGNDFRI